jgi:hypothetical protein
MNILALSFVHSAGPAGKMTLLNSQEIVSENRSKQNREWTELCLRCHSLVLTSKNGSRFEHVLR